MTTEPDCNNCGHRADHHEAGECWTDKDGNEVWAERDCGCGGYEPEPER